MEQLAPITTRLEPWFQLRHPQFESRYRLHRLDIKAGHFRVENNYNVDQFWDMKNHGKIKVNAKLGDSGKVWNTNQIVGIDHAVSSLAELNQAARSLADKVRSDQNNIGEVRFSPGVRLEDGSVRPPMVIWEKNNIINSASVYPSDEAAKDKLFLNTLLRNNDPKHLRLPQQYFK